MLALSVTDRVAHFLSAKVEQEKVLHMRLNRKSHAQVTSGANFRNKALKETEALAYKSRCPICGKPVQLETAITDEYGKAIHDDCYLLKLRLKQAGSANPL